MHKLILTFLLHHEGKTYRAKSLGLQLSIQRLPKGAALTFSTDDDTEASVLARAAFDGIEWNTDSLRRLVEVYESIETQSTEIS